MSHRVLTDTAGSSWQVWSVFPMGQRSAPVLTVAPQYASGWLAFERVGPAEGTAEKRRLAPIPERWVEASESELLALLAQATPVAQRQRTARS
jgi:hypothetical protein